MKLGKQYQNSIKDSLIVFHRRFKESISIILGAVFLISLNILVFSYLYWENIHLFTVNEEVTMINGIGDMVYFSIINYFTVGFGDILPMDPHARMLVMIQATSAFIFNLIIGGYIVYRIIKPFKNLELSEKLIMNTMDDRIELITRYKVIDRKSWMYNMNTKISIILLTDGAFGDVVVGKQYKSTRDIARGIIDSVIIVDDKAEMVYLRKLIERIKENDLNCGFAIRLYLTGNTENGYVQQIVKKIDPVKFSELILFNSKFETCTKYEFIEGNLKLKIIKNKKFDEVIPRIH